MSDVSSSGSERAASAVIRSIEDRILSGSFPDGEHLPAERELMDMFGVSRTVIREAVTVLASRGFLKSKPRFRPMVRRPGYEAVLDAVDAVAGHMLKNAAGIKNLFDSRIFLEKSLVRHAALHARRDDIEALSRAIKANEAAIGKSDEFYATDVAFHGVLYQVPRNPVFPAVHNGYVAWLSPHWRKMPGLPERNRANFLRHREIYQAIVDRDPDTAEKAMEMHLISAWEFVRGTFD